MLETALSLLVLGAMALFAGAVFLWRRGERRRPVLMVVLGLVMAANIGIWTLPDAGGNTLAAGAAPDRTRRP